MVPPADDHDCYYKAQMQRVSSELDEVKAKLAALERRLLGPKSEKLPPLDRELRKEQRPDPEATQAKRRANAELKTARVDAEEVHHRVRDEDRCCPHCGKDQLKSVGDGKPSTEWDYVPGYFRRRVHLRETLACSCGHYIVTAPAPDKPADQLRYGPGFIAHICVAKCGDSLPLYRLEKQYKRIGIPVARSTMTELFHRAAEIVAPLAERLVELVRASDIVLADETSIRMLGTTKRAFVWTFIGGNLIVYRFSPDRSGETPAQVLGGTAGTLLVDMYTGYNQVTSTGGRQRAACLAHARRRFFEAKDYAREAVTALDLIRDVYRVEHEARTGGLIGTAEHLALRQQKTRPIMAELHDWLVAQRDQHPPKGPMGSAIGYALNHWTALTRFLDDPKLPPDNNRSEAALRVVALGRKNFLFVGNEDAGRNIAGLYSLIATCEANGVNPLAYLTDVLLRTRVHPAARIDELLPHLWRPPSGAGARAPAPIAAAP